MANYGGPIIDEKNYSVLNAGVRYGALTRADAIAKAESLVAEWRALGYLHGRKAEVWYCGGGPAILVATFGETPVVIPPAKKTRANRIRVVCMECDRKFATANPLPECPKCGGTDIEPA